MPASVKGLPLRQEMDSSMAHLHKTIPTVAENSFEVFWLQPRGEQRHASSSGSARSPSRATTRVPGGPRVTTRWALELDEYGDARKSCSAVYGRTVADPTLPAEVIRDQRQRYITYTETDYTPDIGQGIPGDNHRLGPLGVEKL